MPAAIALRGVLLGWRLGGLRGFGRFWVWASVSSLQIILQIIWFYSWHMLHELMTTETYECNDT